MDIMDLMDFLFTNALECSTDDLDNFSEWATEEQCEELAKLMFEEKFEEGKILLNKVLNENKDRNNQGN